MATTRSTIELQVVGLEDLRALNRAMTTWEKHLQTAQQASSQYNASLLTVQQSLVSVTSATTGATNATKTHNQAVQQSGQAAQGATRATNDFLGSMLKYRALSAVTQLLQETTKASKEYELQTARVSRVRDGVSSPLITSELRQEVARYGVEIKDAGEGQYQLGTAIQNSNTLLAAQDTLLKLVVGTQADARQTARAMIQVVNEFPDAFKNAGSEQEKYRRAGELLAITFKDSNAEMGEISNSLKYLGPAFQSLGVNAEQAFGFITAATQAGVRGSKAGTDAASFFLSVIKKYNQELHGIEHKGKVYHFEIAYNKQGGIDAIETLKNIKRMSESLPSNEQRAFTVAVSGTTKGFSFLGREGPAQLKAVEEAIKHAKEATSGLTHEADDLAKKMQEPVWAQFGRAIAGGLGVASGVLDDILRKLNLLGGKDGYLKTVADGFENILANKTNEQQSSDRITHRSLLVDAQEKQQASFIAKSFIASHPNAGQDWRQADGSLKKFYTIDDFAKLGPHAVSGADMQGGDMGGGQLTAAQMNLFKAYFAEHTKTGYADAADIDQMFQQAKTNAGIFGAQEKAKAAQVKQTRVKFRVPGDEKKVNPSLLAEMQDIAEDMGMTLTVGTAISGHSVLTKSGHVSRHVGGNAFDITEINGHPANVKDKAGAALADQFVAKLQDQGFGFGESHKQAYLWRTDIGGNHFNHIHVSDTSHDYDGPAVTDSPKTIEEKKRKAEAAARKREAEARKREAATEKAERERDERRKEAAEKSGIYYDAAAKILNPFDPKLMAKAKDADRLSSLAADDNGKLRLKLGLDGKTAELKQRQRDDYTSFFGIPVSKDAVKAAQDKIQSWTEASSAEQKNRADTVSANREASAQSQQDAVNEQIRRIDLTGRPGVFGADPDKIERSQLLEKRDVLQKAISGIEDGAKGLTGPLPDKIAENLKQFRDNLESVNHEIQGLSDQIGGKWFEKWAGKVDESINTGRDKIASDQRPRLHETSDDKDDREQDRLDKIAAYDWSHIFVFSKDGNDIQRALTSGRTARVNREDRQVEKYNGIEESAKSTINGAMMEFFHGGAIGGVFKAAGDSIVNSALENALKDWNNPLIEATTNQIASLEGVKVALDNNTAALTGDPSASGLGGGSDAGQAAGSKGKGKGGLGGAGKYLGAGLGAYSIFEQGQQTGVNAGGILGGAVSGAGIGASFGPGGALAGAIAGGALSLLGGLFGGHKKDPLEESRNHDPSQYNAPGDFDYYAYRYRMTGTLPTASQLGVTLNQQPAPIVNVYVDQVKAAVRSEIASQTNSASASTSNTYYDSSKPL